MNSPGQRGRRFAQGGVEAAGWTLSPSRLAGRRLFFVEPPHMQVSTLLVPGRRVRTGAGRRGGSRRTDTTTHFDAVHLA